MLLLLLGAFTALAAEVQPGRIIDDVKCAADPSQSYALYLPAGYSAERSWALILAFDARARGRTPVALYQEAAERYGYIVAGSNNSQNGPWEVSLAAAKAMAADVLAHFSIDAKRVYTAGMSGGARVALNIALGSGGTAGVIASSGGFPDRQPRKSVPFAVFSTAGTDDFNYSEMRRLDRTLTSPHRLAVFEGGHAWPPGAVAVEAVEWMEIQAMKSALTARDQALIDRIYARRTAALAAAKSDQDAFVALEALVEDFTGLRDVAGFTARAAALGRDKRVREALKQERAEEDREQRQWSEILVLENQLESPEQRMDALTELSDRWKRLAAAASASVDSSDRRVARRVFRGLLARPDRIKDPAYLKLVEPYRRQ